MPLAIIKRIILCYNKYNSYFIQFLDNYFRHSNYQRKTNFQNGMKITLITVTYNSEKYLAHCIDSVQNQTYKNIEHIIVDGNSTDNTINIIKDYGAGISKWISEPDKGMYDAINKGIAMATGDVIGVLNSDDMLYSEDIIENIAKTFDEQQVDSVYGDLQFRPGSYNPGVQNMERKKV